VLEAFDFHLIGEEIVGGRPAYVLHATPHPGYHAHGKYAKMFSKVEGKLWVDKQDFGWIKVDGQVTQSFSIGLILARVERGSSYLQEKTGKQVEIGRLALTSFPVSIHIDHFDVKNPPIFPSGYVVQVARIDAELCIAALLHRQVVIKSLVLEGAHPEYDFGSGRPMELRESSIDGFGEHLSSWSDFEGAN
jgi:hypothetical protein